MMTDQEFVDDLLRREGESDPFVKFRVTEAELGRILDNANLLSLVDAMGRPMGTPLMSREEMERDYRTGHCRLGNHELEIVPGE